MRGPRWAKARKMFLKIRVEQWKANQEEKHKMNWKLDVWIKYAKETNLDSMLTKINHCQLHYFQNNTFSGGSHVNFLYRCM